MENGDEGEGSGVERSLRDECFGLIRQEGERERVRVRDRPSKDMKSLILEHILGTLRLIAKKWAVGDSVV